MVRKALARVTNREGFEVAGESRGSHGLGWPGARPRLKVGPDK